MISFSKNPGQKVKIKAQLGVNKDTGRQQHSKMFFSISHLGSFVEISHFLGRQLDLQVPFGEFLEGNWHNMKWHN